MKRHGQAACLMIAIRNKTSTNAFSMPALTAPSPARTFSPVSRAVRRAPFLSAPCAVLAAALLATASAPARAAPDHVFVQAGAGENAAQVALGVTQPWDWQHPFAGGTLTGLWELAVGRWRGKDARGAATRATQIGITPSLRWTPGTSRWFVEGGIGLNVITPRYRKHDDHFSTTFNFGDHLAIGRRLGADDRGELSLRAQHFSNGGIRKPNPGEQFLQLRLSWRF